MNAIITKDYAVSDTRKYQTHVLPRLEEIYEWIREGCTDYSIAKSLGICHDTLIQYKKNQSELIETYTHARKERNNLTYNSMHQKANGMKVEVKKQKVLNNGTIVDYVEEQYIPPDVNAADLDLRNHDPNYKGAKNGDGITLIQNTIRVPELEDRLQKIRLEREQLKKELAINVDFTEVVEAE